MKNMVRGAHSLHRITPAIQDILQGSKSGLVCPGRQSDQDRCIGHQDVPAIDASLRAQKVNFVSEACECRSNGLSFTCSRGRTRPEDDGTTRQAERCIFDKNRVGECFQRRQHFDFQPSPLKNFDVRIVLSREPLDIRLAPVDRPQSVGDAQAGLAHNGIGKPI